MSDELTPHSRVEQLLDALRNDGEIPEGLVPDSRVESYLMSLLKGETPNVEPLSRIDMYLEALCKKGLGGGASAIYNETTGELTITGSGVTYNDDTAELLI